MRRPSSTITFLPTRISNEAVSPRRRCGMISKLISFFDRWNVFFSKKMSRICSSV